MHQRLLVSLAVICACSAQAAENPTPQALPSSATAEANAKPTVRRLPAPTMSVMRVTRQPDGTLATDCVQQPNPKAQKRAAQP
jgi:hypothetical protein